MYDKNNQTNLKFDFAPFRFWVSYYEPPLIAKLNNIQNEIFTEILAYASFIKIIQVSGILVLNIARRCNYLYYIEEIPHWRTICILLVQMIHYFQKQTNIFYNK